MNSDLQHDLETYGYDKSVDNGARFYGTKNLPLPTKWYVPRIPMMIVKNSEVNPMEEDAD